MLLTHALLFLFTIDACLSLTSFPLTRTTDSCPINHYFYPGNLSCIPCSPPPISVSVSFTDCSIPEVTSCPLTSVPMPYSCSSYCAAKAQACVYQANACLLSISCANPNEQCCQCQDFNALNLNHDDVASYLVDNPITQVFSVTGENADRLPIYFARFGKDGRFLGLTSDWNLFSPCSDREASFRIGTLVGTNFFISCQQTNPSTNNDTIFIEAYFLQANSLLPIPFYVNFPNGNACYRRRIYQHIFGTRELTFIQSVRLNMNFDASSKQIQTPTFSVSYALNTTHSQSSLSIRYSQDQIGLTLGIVIPIAILLVVSFLWVGIQINGWMRKTGRTFCDPVTFLIIFIFVSKYLSIAIFFVTFITSFFLLLIYKSQSKLFFIIPDPSEEIQLVVLLTVALVLKFVNVAYVIFLQCTADVFIIDWERESPLKQDRVSIWRSYLIANEWLKLQTFRMINVAPLLLALIVILSGIGLINISSSQPLTVIDPTSAFLAVSSRYLRVAVSSIFFLIIAFFLAIVSFIYERFFEHKLNQFTDLCSISNISFIGFPYTLFGYYIHGRSVHGQADTDLRTLNQFLIKEEEDIVGKRGLDGSSDQVFEVGITPEFRAYYDRIMRQTDLARTGERIHSNSLHESVILAHPMLNKLFTSFFEKSHKTFQYEKRDKLLCERVTCIELYDPIEVSYLYPDQSNNFSQLIHTGYEWTFLLFNLLTFLFWDAVTLNSIAAAFLTYLSDRILIGIRKIWAKHNIAKKSLLDKRFLI